MKKQRLVICLSLFAFLFFFPLQKAYTEDPILVDTNSCESDLDCKTDIPCNIDRCIIEEGQSKGLCFHIPAECGPPPPPPPTNCDDEDACTLDLITEQGCEHQSIPNCPSPLDPCSPLVPRTLAISCDPPPPPPPPPPPSEKTPRPETPSDSSPATPPSPSPSPLPANNPSPSIDYLQGSGGCSLQKYSSTDF